MRLLAEPRDTPPRAAGAPAERGPLLSRELEDRSVGEKEERRWYGSRNVGHAHVAPPPGRGRGRRESPGSGCGTFRARAPRDRDPEDAGRGAAPPRRSLPRARRAARGRRLGGAPRGARRRRARPSHVPLPLRPADPRPRSRRGAVRLPLPARDVRAEGEACTGTTSCRSSGAPRSSGGSSRSSIAAAVCSGSRASGRSRGTCGLRGRASGTPWTKLAGWLRAESVDVGGGRAARVGEGAAGIAPETPEEEHVPG